MKRRIAKIKERIATTIYALTGTFLQTAPLISNAASAANAGAQAVNQTMGNFQAIMVALISSFGSIILLWGVFEFGTAIQSPNGTEQTQGFKRIAGGLVMTIAPSIVVGLTA